VLAFIQVFSEPDAAVPACAAAAPVGAVADVAVVVGAVAVHAAEDVVAVVEAVASPGEQAEPERAVTLAQAALEPGGLQATAPGEPVELDEPASPGG
jgi:hypothetical protein